MNKFRLILFIIFLFLNAFSFSQNVGIGTNTPTAKLHVSEGSLVVESAGFPPDAPGAPPVSGIGRRMMWYADKAAFRAGFSGGDVWDMGNIGQYSFGVGQNSLASGFESAAFSQAKALGTASFATPGGEALADYSTAIGPSTSADAPNSTAIGFASYAHGEYSSAIGNAARSDGYSSIAIGKSVYAKAYGSIVMGAYNDPIASSNQTTWVGNDPLLIIGNGDFIDPGNALIVLKNGNVGIGTNYPASKLEVSGNAKFTTIQLGSSPTISNIQSGTHTAGASATGQLITTITFANSFSTAPKLIATVKHDPAWNVSDAFCVTVKSVSTTQAVVLIKRVDANAAWNQNLLVDYIAIQ